MHLKENIPRVGHGGGGQNMFWFLLPTGYDENLGKHLGFCKVATMI